MKDLEVGDYVRTWTKGIKKIDKFFENAPMNRYGYYTGDGDIFGKEYDCIRTDNIKKSSKTLINLIEVGDLVNGKKVVDIEFGNHGTLPHIIFNLTDYDFICKEEIKTIVTKEQLKQIEYRVEE